MSSDITKRPQRVAFKPERVNLSSTMPAEWIIHDIRVGNRSQIPRGWARVRDVLRRVWRRVTWFWPRKPPEIRLINGGRR